MRLRSMCCKRSMALLFPSIVITLAVATAANTSKVFAQSTSASSTEDKIPGVPGTVPKPGKIFLREQKRSSKKSNPKGLAQELPSVSDEETDASLESDDGSPPTKSDSPLRPDDLGNGLKLPSVNQVDPKSGQTLNNQENSEQANAKLLPHLELAPAPGIAAYLGQTLVLRAKQKFVPKAKVPSNIAWILQGKVICTKEECEIPLDGKTLGVGTTYIMLVSYNAYGSTYTRHVLQVLKSNWNPSKPFDTKQRREEAPVPIKVPAEQASADSSRIYMLRGNAVQAYPDYLNVVCSVPRPFEFRGRLKTQDVAVARAKDPASGDWFVLGYTEAELRLDARSGGRSMEITKGGVRLHHISSKENAEKAKKQASFVQNAALVTKEAVVVPTEGGDIYVTRLKPSKKSLARAAEARKAGKSASSVVVEAQTSTRVVVISGQAKITLTKPPSGKPKEIALPSGVEFVVYEDGTIASLAKPNPKRMAKLIRMTVTPEEVMEKARARAGSAQVNIKAALLQANQYLQNEDYFEVLNLIAPLEERAKEEPRILYLLGIANKGTYQVEEAEKYFVRALELEPSMADAHWQIAQMQLELKGWEKADSAIGMAAENFADEDPRLAEVPYYHGVVQFNLDSTFSARNSFTRALWEESLDSALKQSAASFLQNLGKRKNWSLVVPMGAQYDHNALGLGSNEAVTEPFKRRNLVRSLAGIIYNWDKAINAQTSGLYWGAGAKVMSLYNFPNSFKSLNATVADVSLTQTFVSIQSPKENETPQETNMTKLYQSFGLVSLDNKLSTATFTLGVTLNKLDLNTAYEHDVVGKGSENKSAAILRQAVGVGLFSSESGHSFDLDISFEERAPLKNSAANGNTFSATASPGFSSSISSRASSKVSLAVGAEYKSITPSTTTYKIGPTLSFNYFLRPWLLAVTSASYEHQLAKPENKKIHKPGASFILTGLF